MIHHKTAYEYSEKRLHVLCFLRSRVSCFTGAVSVSRRYLIMNMVCVSPGGAYAEANSTHVEASSYRGDDLPPQCRMPCFLRLPVSNKLVKAYKVHVYREKARFNLCRHVLRSDENLRPCAGTLHGSTNDHCIIPFDIHLAPSLTVWMECHAALAASLATAWTQGGVQGTRESAWTAHVHFFRAFWRTSFLDKAI